MDLSEDRPRGGDGDGGGDYDDDGDEEEDDIISNINRPAQTHTCYEQLMISLNLFPPSSVCAKTLLTCPKPKLSFYLVLHLH
jgi:hypothetical protein